MAVTPLNLLTAALGQTGLPTDAGTATATAGQPATLAGLFQSVLAGAVTQAAAPLPDEATSSLETGQTDLLAQLLGLLDNATEAADAEEQSAVNAELLSQLLASLGLNAQQFAALAPLPTDAPGTAAAVVPAQTLTVPTNLSGAALAASNVRPAVANAPAPTPPDLRSDQPPATPPSRPAVTSAPATPSPGTATAAPPVLVAPAVTVADANRVAGRAPAVVLQTPVDPGRQPPPAVLPLGSDAVQPPVNELTPVRGLPPVQPSDGTAVARNPRGEVQPAEAAPVPVPRAPGSTFAAAFEAAAKPTPAQPAAPLIAGPTTTTAGPVQAKDTPAPTAARGEVAATRIPTATPPPTAAPPPTATPDIAVTVAQPVGVPVERIDVAQRFGFAGILASPTRLEDAPAREAEIVQPVGLGGVSTAPGFSSARPSDTPILAPSSASPAPVAEQLSGPIVANLRIRPVEGETEIQVRLDPPELGSVKLKIVSSGGDVRAELHVISDAVRRVVESQLPELRQKLDDAGVKVQRFDVSADSQGGTARDDRGDRWRETPPLDLPPPPVRPRRAPAGLSALGRVDVSV